MIFDSHAHLIADDPVRYPPAPPSGEVKPEQLANPMTAERLLGEMDKNGVGKAVLVQRGSIYGFDNRYVCDSAARYPDRFAAVCSIDATAEDAPQAVRRWVEAGAAGIRLMELIKGSDLSWLDAPRAREVWRTALAMRVPVCVHLFPWNRTAGLTALESILTALPGLTVVIDHFSNMNVQAGPPDFGVDELLRKVAAFPGVYIKFTTIPLGRLDTAGVDAAPILARVAELFGTKRMMWGTDIGQTPGTYEYMVGLAHRAVRMLQPAERQQVFEESVRAVYGSKWS